jgi:anaerobic selenocysteine-containing dehydrogenase
VDLFPAALDASAPMGLHRFQPDPGTGRYPLALISPASDRTISSTLGELPRSDARLTMHPDDAQARGLEDNDLVRVFNDLAGALHRERESSIGGQSPARKGCGGAAPVTAPPRRAAPDTLTDPAAGMFNDARVGRVFW